MKSRSKYLLRNVGILTISNFASKILVFLLVPLYTSVLSAEEVGIYDLIVSTVSLFVPLLTVNIVDAVMRFSMDKARSKEEVAVIGIRFISISIFIVIIFVIIISRTEVFNQIKGFELFITLYYISYIFNNFMIQFSKGLERIGDMGAAGILGTLAMLGANILFLIILRRGLSGFFIANILGQAIPALYLIVRINLWKYIGTLRTNKILQKEMILYCAPLIATTVGWWVNNASDKYVVSFLCGISANGILSVSYKIPSIINTLHSIFTQAWQISAVKEYGNQDSSLFYGRAFTMLNVVLSAICSWLIILSKPVGRILYQKEFFDAWQYVPFLLISCVLNSASGFCGSILSAKKDSKSMAISALCGAVANILMNFGFVYWIGVQGAAIATAIASFIIYYIRKKSVEQDIIIQSYWVAIFTWILLAVQAVIEVYMSAWWVELGLMMIMCALNWNYIKEIFFVGLSLIRKENM